MLKNSICFRNEERKKSYFDKFLDSSSWHSNTVRDNCMHGVYICAIVMFVMFFFLSLSVLCVHFNLIVYIGILLLAVCSYCTPYTAFI